MEYMLDTANLEELKRGFDCYPIVGVTSNPSILKSEGKIDLRAHLQAVCKLCGPERSLHVQVLAEDCDGILRDADAIFNAVGENTFIKIPVTEQGLKAIGKLKARGKNVTATAIYYQAQGLLAIAAGADYLAPYCNRMENNDIDFRRSIEAFREIIDRDGYDSKILGASFKNIGQVNDAILSGAHAVTVAPAVLRSPLASALLWDGIHNFEKDFALVNGDVTLAELLK